MLYIDAFRDICLGLLPKGGTVAEVGVAEGEFSAEILTIIQPEQLYLIDPWEYQDCSQYNSDPNNVDMDENELRYKLVSEKFQNNPHVQILREYSYNVAGRLLQASLDFVYIDAMHTYDAVLKDLRCFAPLIKPGGLILGHDFADHPKARAMHFGVIPAVQTFVNESEWQILAVTGGYFPTYLLHRTEELPGYRDIFIHNLFQSHLSFIELPAALAASFNHRCFVKNNGEVRWHSVFGAESILDEIQ